MAMTEGTMPLRTERRKGGFPRDLKTLIRNVREGCGYCAGELPDVLRDMCDEEESLDELESTRVFQWLGLPPIDEPEWIASHFVESAREVFGVALAKRLDDKIIERIETLKKSYVMAPSGATIALCRSVIDVCAQEWLIGRKAPYKGRQLKWDDRIDWGFMKEHAQ